MAELPIYQFATLLRQRLAKAESAPASRMIRAYAQALARINQRLAAITAQIEQAKALGADISPAWLFQQERYARFAQQVAEEMNLLAQGAGGAITQAQQAAVDLALQSAPQMIAAAHAALGSNPAQWAPAAANFARLPKKELQNLVGFLADGSPLTDVLKKHNAQTVEQMKNALITGVATGQGADVVAREIQRAMGQSLSRALTISRTEIHRVHRETTREIYGENKDVVRGWRWYATLDGHTCACCCALHGSFHGLTERLHGHPNCRCTMIPALYGETDADFETGPEWFAKQDEAMQAGMVGQRGLALVKGGDLTIEDFAAFHSDLKWGGMWRDASLAEALANHGGAGKPVVFHVAPKAAPPVGEPKTHPSIYAPLLTPPAAKPANPAKEIARTLAKAHKGAVADFATTLDAVAAAKQEAHAAAIAGGPLGSIVGTLDGVKAQASAFAGGIADQLAGIAHEKEAAHAALPPAHPATPEPPTGIEAQLAAEIAHLESEIAAEMANPDALSQQIIASLTQQLDDAKAHLAQIKNAGGAPAAGGVASFADLIEQAKALTVPLDAGGMSYEQHKAKADALVAKTPADIIDVAALEDEMHDGYISSYLFQSLLAKAESAAPPGAASAAGAPPVAKVLENIGYLKAGLAQGNLSSEGYALEIKKLLAQHPLTQTEITHAFALDQITGDEANALHDALKLAGAKPQKPPSAKANLAKAVKLQAKVDAAQIAFADAHAAHVNAPFSEAKAAEKALAKAEKALWKAKAALEDHIAATGVTPPPSGMAANTLVAPAGAPSGTSSTPVSPVAVPAPSAGVRRGMDAVPFDLARAKVLPAHQIPSGPAAGMHTKVVYTDATGKDWLFKPQDEFRAQVDKATAALMRLSGLVAPDTYVVSINGQVGSIQEMLAPVGEMRPAFTGAFDPTKLDAKDVLELQKHAVFDWLVGNNDGHKDNFIKTKGTSGKIFGIDKGQAFKFYAKDRLAYDYKPNPVDTVYNQMHRAYAEGKAVSLDLVDTSGGGPVADFIRNLQALSDQQIVDILTPYAEGAKQAGFLNTYSAQKNDVDAFLRAVLERKANLLKDWARYHAELEAKRNAALGIVPATPVPPPGVKGMVGATEHRTNAAGTQWAKAKWGNVGTNPALTRAEREALTRYTGSYYQTVNSTLRSGATPPPDMQRVIDNMDAAMRKLPVPEDVIVWRGTGADGLGITGRGPLNRLRSLIGTIHQNKGYMSTSVGKEPAFAHYDVWMRIRANKGAQGTYIAPISGIPSERELLLARNTRYYIHDVRYDGSVGKWIVDVEVIDGGT